MGNENIIKEREMKGKKRKEKKSSNLTYNLTRTYFVSIDVYIYITITRTLLPHPLFIRLWKCENTVINILLPKLIFIST